MQKLKWKAIVRWSSGWAGLCLFAVQGCTIDPDIRLRAALSSGSDLAIFLLENMANGL